VDRGFVVFDAAGSKRPSLDLFLSRWRAFRSGAPPVVVDEFAEAIVAGDLARLGVMIGGSDVSKIRIDVAMLPRDLPRRPGKDKIGLLDIAAAVGGAPLRYLLEFFAVTPTIDTLHQAIASGDSESIHTVFDRVNGRSALLKRKELAKTSAEFHFVGVVNWLLKDAGRRTHELLRDFAAEHRLIDVVLGMTSLPADGPVSGVFCRSMAWAYEDELLEWLPGMADATLLAKCEGRDKTSVNAFIDAAKRRAHTITFIETENGKSICGASVEPAWVDPGQDRACTHDPSKRTFLFTLKNHLGVAPTKFPCKSPECTVFLRRDRVVIFTSNNWGMHITPETNGYMSVTGYKDTAGKGGEVFCGDGSGFRAARWELWEIA
jgi:hypothetical protein